MMNPPLPKPSTASRAGQEARRTLVRHSEVVIFALGTVLGAVVALLGSAN